MYKLYCKTAQSTKGCRRVAHVACPYKASDSPIRRDFLMKQNSIKKFKSDDFIGLAIDFKTYGRFINFCVSNSIPLTRESRQGVMNKTLQYTHGGGSAHNLKVTK